MYYYLVPCHTLRSSLSPSFQTVIGYLVAHTHTEIHFMLTRKSVWCVYIFISLSIMFSLSMCWCDYDAPRFVKMSTHTYACARTYGYVSPPWQDERTERMTRVRLGAGRTVRSKTGFCIHIIIVHLFEKLHFTYTHTSWCVYLLNRTTITAYH